MNDHELVLSRTPRKYTQPGHGGRSYCTVGNCSCGEWKAKSGLAPSKGGRRLIIKLHREHLRNVQEETGLYVPQRKQERT